MLLDLSPATIDRLLARCNRLLASPDISAAMKKKLRQTRAALNPFDWQRRLETALRPLQLQNQSQPRCHDF